jgi:hypothetical protein
MQSPLRFIADMLPASTQKSIPSMFKLVQSQSTSLSILWRLVNVIRASTSGLSLRLGLQAPIQVVMMDELSRSKKERLTLLILQDIRLHQ